MKTKMFISLNLFSIISFLLLTFCFYFILQNKNNLLFQQMYLTLNKAFSLYSAIIFCLILLLLFYILEKKIYKYKIKNAYEINFKNNFQKNTYNIFFNSFFYFGIANIIIYIFTLLIFVSL